MNKVILVGRLTADPNVKTGTTNAGEYTVAQFSLAVDRRFKKDGDKTADFFNCTAFGKTAQFISKYFSKGRRIMVVGRLENDDYTSKDGNKVHTVKVIIEEAEFGDSKKDQPGTPEDFVSVPDDVSANLPF